MAGQLSQLSVHQAPSEQKTTSASLAQKARPSIESSQERSVLIVEAFCQFSSPCALAERGVEVPERAVDRRHRVERGQALSGRSSIEHLERGREPLRVRRDGSGGDEARPKMGPTAEGRSFDDRPRAAQAVRASPGWYSTSLDARAELRDAKVLISTTDAGLLVRGGGGRRLHLVSLGRRCQASILVDLMPGRETVIHIVRHGATDWSQLGRHTGRSDVPLNPLGEEQARKLAPALTATTFDRVLSSPLVRAQRTAELAGFPGCETSSLLLESDYGDYEGQTRAAIQQDRPGWDYFIDGAKGGESIDEVTARARTLIAELEGTVLLFSHAHMSRILTMAWLGKASRDGRHLSIHPASIGILARDRDIPVIRLWNFTPA